MTQWYNVSDLREAIFACENGNHKFEVIHSGDNGGPGGGQVVRWCVNCGSVVVDHDVDGRTHPGYYSKLRSPLITKCT